MSRVESRQFKVTTWRSGRGWGWDLRILGRYFGFDSRDFLIIASGSVSGAQTPRRHVAYHAAAAAKRLWIEEARVGSVDGAFMAKALGMPEGSSSIAMARRADAMRKALHDIESNFDHKHSNRGQVPKGQCDGRWGCRACTAQEALSA